MQEWQHFTYRMPWKEACNEQNAAAADSHPSAGLFYPALPGLRRLTHPTEERAGGGGGAHLGGGGSGSVLIIAMKNGLRWSVPVPL